MAEICHHKDHFLYSPSFVQSTYSYNPCIIVEGQTKSKPQAPDVIDYSCDKNIYPQPK